MSVQGPGAVGMLGGSGLQCRQHLRNQLCSQISPSHHVGGHHSARAPFQLL